VSRSLAVAAASLTIRLNPAEDGAIGAPFDIVMRAWEPAGRQDRRVDHRSTSPALWR